MCIRTCSWTFDKACWKMAISQLMGHAQQLIGLFGTDTKINRQVQRWNAKCRPQKDLFCLVILDPLILGYFHMN